MLSLSRRRREDLWSAVAGGDGIGEMKPGGGGEEEEGVRTGSG